ncbi:DUF6088 family protein [Pseudomonas aeruginosa]|uniref:DUF6088 family protein n=1 Tax=Pseudomonas aeruginosa TaxID=287 RepID=UPI001C8CDD4B|nr:DUF6088 family protein [Pseudomonas aeruginosa]
MSVSRGVAERVKRLKIGEPFLAGKFRDLGTQSAVNSALCRLVGLGEIERVVRGIYVRPRMHSILGKVSPSYIEVLNLIVKSSAETLQTHGVEAVRKFGLSTQMQVRPVFYTSGRSRKLEIGNLVIELRHAPKEWLQNSESLAGLAIVAMFYIGRGSLDKEQCLSIMKKMPSQELSKLVRANMPAWMRVQCDFALKELLPLGV